MKPFLWDSQKNLWLQIHRGISFEEIERVIACGGILDILPHPNSARYPHQRIYLLEIDEYVWVVPFVEDTEKIFLKTCFPHRKYTHQYLGK